MPQRMGRPAAAEHPQVEAVEGRRGLVLLRRVAGEPLLPLRAGGGKLAQSESRAPQGPVGSEEIQRVVEVLGQGEEFLTQLPYGL